MKNISFWIRNGNYKEYNECISSFQNAQNGIWELGDFMVKIDLNSIAFECSVLFNIFYMG